MPFKKGNGPGWGGPAKGAGSTAPKSPDFTPDLAREVVAQRGSPRAWAKREFRERHVAELYERLDALSSAAEDEAVRVRATEAMLNRLDGMPVQRNMNINVDAGETIDAEARRARIAELTRVLGSGGTGVVEAAGGGVSDPPAG